MIPHDIQPNLHDLPDYLAWSQDGHDPLGLFATFTTPPDQVIAMARFFYPEFDVYRGGVFRKDEYTPFTVDHWLERLDGDMTAVERMVNFRHIADIFRDQCGNWGPDTMGFLGHVIRNTWAIALAITFTDRDFEVTAEREDADSSDVVVTFWQTGGRREGA